MAKRKKTDVQDGTGAPGEEALEPVSSWDAEECRALIAELDALRANMKAQAQRHAARLAAVDPRHAPSATNLVHYLALRRSDLRSLQRRLALLGLSSLGRSESHVLAAVDKVLGALHAMSGLAWEPRHAEEPVGARRGPATLTRNATALFGPPPPGRAVRIMVTLPSEAATDPAVAQRMVAAGMDIARINCAHDDAPAWEAMAAHVRAAARAAGRDVRVLMDLGGPKLRTGRLQPGGMVFKLRPARDERGHVLLPARVLVQAPGQVAGTGDAALTVDGAWLGDLREGDTVTCTDLRDARRRLRVVARTAAGAVLECDRTAYLGTETVLQHDARDGDEAMTRILALPASAARLHVARGDRLRLVAEDAAAPSTRKPGPPRVPITLPEALRSVRRGQPVWFDDGRIGAVVVAHRAAGVDVEVNAVRSGGDWLGQDKGINLPETHLTLPALTAKDVDDLAVAARCADLVGLSFAQSARDVRALRERLLALGAGTLGIVLKVETRRGFESLPDLLLAALETPRAGVMIARGDLAVECGWERMAEVQEEMLWACEAAHVPVVWATQVLETLATTGRPSRAEITDAAMSGRAECVMLNKGPFIDDAIRALDDILRRMQSHQSKKRTMLRALKAW